MTPSAKIILGAVFFVSAVAPAGAVQDPGDLPGQSPETAIIKRPAAPPPAAEKKPAPAEKAAAAPKAAPAAAPAGNLPSPEVSPDHFALFPWHGGEKKLYILYYGSRRHDQRMVAQACVWDEAVAVTDIHGYRTVVIRSSKGTMGKKDGKWVYGDAERILEERVYVVTDQGVDLLLTYSRPKGSDSDQDFRMKRDELLALVKSQDKEQFLKGLKDWVLPFPPAPGSRRRWGAPDGKSQKILDGGSKKFVHKDFQEKTVGVAGYKGRKWETTRWFVPFKGLVTQETFHSDPGVNRAKFPFRIKALAVYAE